jgi:hypothetical protein
MSSGEQTAEQAKAEHIRVMGEPLGLLYDALWQEVAWIHRKWDEHVALFGTKPSRIELLNRSAPSFFRIVQDCLWEDVLLHIARLTDSPQSVGRANLSIRRLPDAVAHVETRQKVETAIGKAIVASEFCRDWRNRRIAHRDLSLALSLGAEPLKPASRTHVVGALAALDAVLNVVSAHYLGSTTIFDFGPQTSAVSLLYAIDDGLKAAAARMERRKSGHFDPQDDYGPRDL